MYTIEHKYAISLERIVSRLFNFNYCNRDEWNVISAGHFEYYPFDAAVMVVSYIYAKELPYDKSQLGIFFNKYESIFRYPEKNNADNEIENYIRDLSEIVAKYV